MNTKCIMGIFKILYPQPHAIKIHEHVHVCMYMYACLAHTSHVMSSLEIMIQKHSDR